jgi:pyruvate kinase
MRLRCGGCAGARSLLGAATASSATVSAMFHAGADLFRINMRHATHDQLRMQVGTIRALQEQCGRPIGILIDLQSPKLRIGTFKDRVVTVAKNHAFVFDSNPAPGDQNRVWLPHPEILSSLKLGHAILIDDGKVRLHVVEASGARAIAITDVAGKISDRKGVSLPDKFRFLRLRKRTGSTLRLRSTRASIGSH